MEQPKKIGDYELLTHCGQGAYGEVWLVKDAAGRILALKRVDKTRIGDGWEREFNGLKAYCQKAQLHPNLIHIYHIADAGDFFYYTMEAADNILPKEFGQYKPSTLSARLECDRIPLDELIPMALQLLDGIEALHQYGLVHRDIKPSNIIFIDGKPKLSDIGLVAQCSSKSTLVGTPGFFPMNDLESSGQPRSDVYAIGKVLYCAMTGNQPEQYPSIPIELTNDPGRQELNKIIQMVCHRIKERRLSRVSDLKKILANFDERVHARQMRSRYVQAFHNFVEAQNARRNCAVLATVLVIALGIWALSNVRMTWFRAYFAKSQQQAAITPLDHQKMLDDDRKWKELGALRKRASAIEATHQYAMLLPAIDGKGKLLFSDALRVEQCPQWDMLASPASGVSFNNGVQIGAGTVFELNLPNISLPSAFEANFELKMAGTDSILSLYVYSASDLKHIYYGEFCFAEHVRLDVGMEGSDGYRSFGNYQMGRDQAQRQVPNTASIINTVPYNGYAICRLVKEGEHISLVIGNETLAAIQLPSTLAAQGNLRFALSVNNRNGEAAIRNFGLLGK